MGSGFLFVLILMFALMYMLLIRPQRAQQRRQQEMLANVKVGDEVITVGGLYGDVVEVQADRISLEIAEDVEVEIAKRAIANVVPAEDAAAREVEEAQAEMLAETEPDAEADPVATAPEDATRR